MTFLRIVIRFSLLVEHDLFRKPVSTFRHHALECSNLPRCPRLRKAALDAPPQSESADQKLLGVAEQGTQTVSSVRIGSGSIKAEAR